MKIYHTETQADYDALMVKLDAEGVRWRSGRRMKGPTYWERYRRYTCVLLKKDKASFDEKDYYVKNYPDIPIIRYRAEEEERMRFSKKSIEKVFNNFMQSGDSIAGLKDSIMTLVDEPEKVVVPKFVAEWIKWNKENEVSLQIMLKCYKGFYESTDARESEGEKAVQWYVDNPYKFIQAYEEGYTIEPEELYYIPLPDLETSDGSQQVLSKSKNGKRYFANRPDEKLKQRYTKAELEQVPEIYKFYAELVKEG